MAICMKKIQTVLSKSALEYIYKYGQPVISHNFIGYIFPANNKMNGVLDLNGQWGFYSCTYDKKGNLKKLREKGILKYVKKLVKQGFLIFQEESPFPEFEYYTNIKFDLNRAKYFEGTLFDGLEEN